MSNLNDFVNPQVNTLISTSEVNFFGAGSEWFVDGNQTMTLNSNTRILRLILTQPGTSGGYVNHRINVTLNGSSTSQTNYTYGDTNASGLFTLVFASFTATGTNFVNYDPLIRDLKVNGGETFKWSLAGQGGGDNDSSASTMVIEEWGY